MVKGTQARIERTLKELAELEAQVRFKRIKLQGLTRRLRQEQAARFREGEAPSTSSSSESESPSGAFPSEPAPVLPLQVAQPVPADAVGGQGPGPVPADAEGGQGPGNGAGAVAASAADPVPGGGGAVPGVTDEAPLRDLPPRVRQDRVTCRACRYRLIEGKAGGPTHAMGSGCFKTPDKNLPRGYRPDFY